MAGLNKVILVGKLGANPETVFSQSGMAICKFSLATDRKVKGEKKTSWHRIVAFDKLAEICGKYLEKGKEVIIEGMIEYGSYEKDGVKHYTTDILANQMTMLSGGERREPAAEAPEPRGMSQEEIPF